MLERVFGNIFFTRKKIFKKSSFKPFPFSIKYVIIRNKAGVKGYGK